MATSAESGAPPAEQQGGEQSAQSSVKEEPKFTQADLNRIIKKETEPFKTELQTLRSQFEEITQQSASMREFIEKLNAPEKEEEVSPLASYEEYLAAHQAPGWVKTEADRRAHANWVRQQWEQRHATALTLNKLSELEEAVTQERAARTAAEAERQEALKQRQQAESKGFLATIATDPEVNAISAAAMQRWFGDSIVYDKAGIMWFKTEDGQLVPPREGILAEMPDHLRKPSTVNGGSGSSSQRTPEPTTAQKLEAAQKQYSDLMDENRKHPHPRLQQEILKARRVMLDLQKAA